MRRIILPMLLTSALLIRGPALAADRFVGDTSCSSSGCHGGAGDKNQSLTWAAKDYHAKAKAILLTARSQRMAETLKIPDAATSPKCLTCHSPMEAVDSALLALGVKADQAVSCESCHGPAERWLRSHTRPDFTHGQRVADGMRDLSTLVNRATACVACHQNLDPDILESGHPELVFELDGQIRAEPPHWQEKTQWLGPQIWLAGQAAAWREINWQLERQPYSVLQERESALNWLLSYLTTHLPELPEFNPPKNDSIAREKYARNYAERAAAFSWNRSLATRTFSMLAASGKELSESPDLAARRAEVLVLALDRILPVADFPPEKKARIETTLNALFQPVQILAEFNSKTFLTSLTELTQTVQAD